MEIVERKWQERREMKRESVCVSNQREVVVHNRKGEQEEACTFLTQVVTRRPLLFLRGGKGKETRREGTRGFSDQTIPHWDVGSSYSIMPMGANPSQ